MNIFTQIKIFAIALVALLLVILGGSVYFALKDAERTKANNEAMLSTIATMRTELKNNSSKVAQIVLSNSEIKKALPEIKENMANLNLRFADLKSYSRVNTSTRLDIKTVLRDSVVNDTLHVKVSNYKDAWNKIEQIIYNDTIITHLAINDTIDDYLTATRPHNFWFVRWGAKKYELTSKARNPYNTITHNLYIVKP